MEFQRETETEDSVSVCLKSYKNLSVCASPGTTSFFRFTVMGMSHDSMRLLESSIIVGNRNGAVSAGIWLQTFRLLEYYVNQFHISFLNLLLICVPRIL